MPSTTDLRASFDRYRFRILGLNDKILHKLLEELSIPLDSTDPAHLQLIEKEEWQLGTRRDPTYSLPSSVRTPNDISALLSDGTSSPRKEEKRNEIFLQIEAALTTQAAPEFRPVRLPDDFKQLCAWTDSITGPGLPKSNHSQIPHCFSGLLIGLTSLNGWVREQPLTVENLKNEAQMDIGWEVGAGMQVGAFEGRGGAYLCWCRSDAEIEGDDQAHVWKWRWILINDVELIWYEDVQEMLDESWDQYLSGIEAVYGEIDVSDLQDIALEIVECSSS